MQRTSYKSPFPFRIRVHQDRNGITIGGPHSEMEPLLPLLKKLGFKWDAGREHWKLPASAIGDLGYFDVRDLNSALTDRGLPPITERDPEAPPEPFRLDLDEYPDSITFYGVPRDPEVTEAMLDAGFSHYDPHDSWQQYKANVDEDDWQSIARALRPHGIDIGSMPRQPRFRRYQAPEPTGTIRTISPARLGPQVFMPRGPLNPSRLLQKSNVRTFDGANKPGGRPAPLWTSTQKGRSTEWLDFCSGSFGYSGGRGTHAAILTAKPSANIVLIDDRNDFIAVQTRYPQTGPSGQGLIDWKALAQDYDAVHASGNAAYAYLKWDLESTVWWNAHTSLTIDRIVAVDLSGDAQCVLRVANRWLRRNDPR